MNNIEKVYSWIQKVKATAPAKLEFVMIFISIFLGAIAIDIQLLFNYEFLYLKAICGFTLLMMISYSLFWIIEVIVLIIYCKVNYHKTPKQICEVIETARKEVEKYENK